MFQYVTIAILAVLLAAVLFNVIKALIRGLKKSVGTLIAIILSAVIAAILTGVLCKPTSTMMVELVNLLQGILPEGEIRDLIAMDEIGTAVSHYAVMLIAPFFFTIAYCLISIVVSIIVAILVKVIPPYKKPGVVANRLGGAGVGLVCGVLVALILLMPIVGTINTVSSLDTSAVLASENGETDEVAALLDEAAASPLLDVFLNVGCGTVYDHFASTDFEGEKVYLKNDLSAVIAMVGDLQKLGGDMAAYSDEQVEAIHHIVANLDSSPLLKNTVAGVLSTASEKWLAGETFLGLDKFSAGELFDPVIDEMLRVMTTSDKNNVGADLSTMADIFGVIIDSGILADGSDYQVMLTKLGKEGVVADLIVAINKNQRMAPLADEITNLSVRALATTIGIPKDADERYSMLMTDLAGLVSDSASAENRSEAINSNLSTVLDNYGVEISGEAATNVADSIVTDLGGLEKVEPADVEEFFIVYAIAGDDADTQAQGNGYSFDLLSEKEKKHDVKFEKDGSIVVDGKTLKNYNQDNYRDSEAYKMGASGADFGGAATLSSSQHMESTMITMTDIVDVLGKYSDCEDIEQEAQKIGEILAEAADVFMNTDLSEAKPTEILDKMGGVLDKMKDTQIFGSGSTENLLTAVVQSGQVTEGLGISKAAATEFANKLNEVGGKSESGYSDATKAVSNTINAINASRDDSLSEEEKIKASEEMINHMTGDNADLITTVISAGIGTGKTEQKPADKEQEGEAAEGEGATTASKEEVVSTVMELLLKNMAAYRATNPSAAEVSREASAVNKMLALSGLSTSAIGDKPLFNTEDQVGVIGSTSDSFISTVINSKVIMETVEETVYGKGFGHNPLGIPSLGVEEEAMVAESLNNYHDANGGGAELARKLEAIAAIINVNVDIQ